MPETNEKNIILQNLNYIGLDLENIPQFLIDYQEVDFQPTKAYEQTDFKVYKYLPLKDIQILLTPTNRLNSMTEKYAKALPICEYLKNNEEQNVLLHAQFLKMLEQLDIKEIEKIEQEQKLAKPNIPFKVKFTTNYLWEIYYSEFTGKYFMMVTTEDQNYNAFFYLLKKQIECWKEEKEETIFVPISYLDYTKRYLKKSEIADMEKYIWLFTKDWPKIYEVFDIHNDMTLHVTGATVVYDKMKSYYKTELTTKEDAFKFYTLVKALFILQTELPHYYAFETQIDEKGELLFELHNKKIHYDNLSSFVKEEYKKHAKELQQILEEKEKLEIALEKLKEEELEKNKEYLFKEKQVATYLECRKSTFGKIKYFFRNKNAKFIKEKRKNNKVKEIKEENAIEKSIANSIIEEKELYTIEDLIKICLELDRFHVRIKEAKMDSKALKEKIEIVENKIKNATIFIAEIEEHKKSIFEFWKFANKDLALGLNAAKEDIQEEKAKKIKRVFDYEEDIEELGIEADRLQRELLSGKETNSLYLATTPILKDMNGIRAGNVITENALKELKTKLKKKDILFDTNRFDIFGNIKNDKTKISVLANQKHRESNKECYKILDLADSTTLEEYIDKIKQELMNVEKCITKVEAITDCNLYYCSNEKLDLNSIQMFYLNPMDAIHANSSIEKTNLYKLKIKEGMSLIYNTNIIYYDNVNQTLPVGMNVNRTVTFDMKSYKIDLKKQKIFRMNGNQGDFDFEEKIICVYEYDVKEKENENTVD